MTIIKTLEHFFLFILIKLSSHLFNWLKNKLIQLRHKFISFWNWRLPHQFLDFGLSQLVQHLAQLLDFVRSIIRLGFIII